MSYRAKIRLLLALLTVSLFITAIVVPRSYTPDNTLEQTAKLLEEGIRQKEGYIKDILADKALFDEFKTLGKKPERALELIHDYTIKKRIWFITTNNNKLAFWSGVKVLPGNPSAIKEGYSFIRQPNGYYEAIRKSEGQFSVIFLFPVKINYAFQNKYLKNGFDNRLLSDNILELADFTDKNVYPVHSSNNNAYLFSVKLKEGAVNNRFFYSELTLWILAFITLCVLVNDICQGIAKAGYAMWAVFGLALFIVTLRFTNLHWGWPDFSYKLDIFNPAYYASSPVYPSLGDFCINVLCICWFSAFLFVNRNFLLNNIKGKTGSYVVLITCIVILITSATALLALFYGLILNSNIDFDVTNVLNLSGFSVIGLIMLCFAFLIFYLLNETFIAICIRLPISNSHKTFLFTLSVIIATAIFTYYLKFTVFFFFMALLVYIRAYAFRYDQTRISAPSLLLMVLICAIISSIELNVFQNLKESGSRKYLVQKLLIPDDGTANEALKRIEKGIAGDVQISALFNKPSQEDYLKSRLQKLYFDGYLSKYEMNVHQFDTNEEPVSARKNYSLNVFKDLVLYSSFKVSDYFYRENDSFGFQNYFAIIPVRKNGTFAGTMVIELKSKNLRLSRSFPDLLVEGSNDANNEFEKYSYAFYTDNKLVSQNGNYVYDLVNMEFNVPLKQFKYVNSKSIHPEWYRRFSQYEHLLYKPSKRNLIVISKEQNNLFYGVTSLTFFFVLLLLFTVLVVSIRWLWLRIKILSISENKIKWGFKINFDRILYKTRIQYSMITAVVVTLILVGFITFLFISTQYNTQQEEMIRDKIARITTAFEEGLFNKYINNIQNEDFNDFEELANTYSADLTLFDLSGNELISTQPKIYESGLHARRMNSRAFIYMRKFHKSEYVNDETLGDLRYKSVYAPLKNSKNETVAFLQLPYFSNEADYKQRIGSLLNAMINVYALIFIAIGLFAVIIARQITAPLNFIQSSLSRIIYGRKNEPIKWDRDDEIGALVKEYNKMIAELENSAQKLAQSERESAWREMAKQVAHEIKNPLTPLKLGLQLLDKSWKDKDPKFDQKFERFSKSFVEQIESLSNIASEFSAFAKMPDTKMELINVFEMLNQAVTIFKQMDNLQIVYTPPDKPFVISADRDQLLRCFNNLLKNAIEATPTERSGLIEINFLITSKNILLSIKDNGNGIPENMREKIFEPNFTTKSSGTGLGLAFIKNSIENAGGKVWFETILNTGTTFYLSLPAAEA